ncbi:MAG: GntR family transcriptional regulator [Pyrinomonadaceae bacterium]
MINIELKDRSEGPVYVQVRDQLDALIRSKQIASGDQLPAPASLGQQLSVDRGEIQRAYFELEHSGLITKTSRKDFLGKVVIKYLVN